MEVWSLIWIQYRKSKFDKPDRELGCYIPQGNKVWGLYSWGMKLKRDNLKLRGLISYFKIKV